jgi:hypothetical protein
MSNAIQGTRQYRPISNADRKEWTMGTDALKGQHNMTPEESIRPLINQVEQLRHHTTPDDIKSAIEKLQAGVGASIDAERASLGVLVRQVADLTKAVEKMDGTLMTLTIQLYMMTQPKALDLAEQHKQVEQADAEAEAREYRGGKLPFTPKPRRDGAQ